MTPSMATAPKQSTDVSEKQTNSHQDPVSIPQELTVPPAETTAAHSTTASIIADTMADIKRVKTRLQLLSTTQAPTSMGSDDAAAVKQLLVEMGDMKGVMSQAKKSVQQWKDSSQAPSKRKVRDKGRERPSKRKRFDIIQKPKNANLEMEERMAVGNDGFSEDLAIAMKGHKYTIQEWYEGISEMSAPNMFVDASYGLYCIAAGLEETETEKMNVVLAQVLADTLETDIMKAIPQTPIKEIQAKHLYRFYKESNDPSHAVNRRPRIVLLQNIVSGIHSLKSSLGWSRLEKGDIENGKKRVVRDAYAVHCQEQGLALDYESSGYVDFARGIKAYNTGVNRYFDAYKKLGSVLLLCPQLSPQRFISSTLGPRLKEAISGMEISDDEGQTRECTHDGILAGVIAILDNENCNLAAGLKDVKEEIGRAPLAHSRRSKGRPKTASASMAT
ncbi:unnamed protein product [Rhizoctonia solani]|uniref:Uncharacterized protein n=1 Tax=Rhizoctonia solani TaxID=456999 RepID=A0A8H3BJ58_9AGAM|nr:unnamed protein product [Rhizoctonia solani]